MERFYFIKEWELLQNGAHAGIVNFAASRAKELSVDLAVCVQNKSSCEQFLVKCFGEKIAKKLLNRKDVSVNGVSIVLESSKTLKHSFVPTERAYLALFPSSELIDAIEKIESKKSLTVFSETSHSEYLVTWYTKFEAKALSEQ
ncbi:hypothetical protein AB6D74_06680 [Vibrio cyclitrophicus]